MEAFQPRKVDKIKAASPIIVAVLSFLGTILVAYFQFVVSARVEENSAKDYTNKKSTEQKIELVVEQINTSIIPSMQGTIQKLVDENMSLRERVVRLETKLDMATERSLLQRFMNKKEDRKEIRTSIPKLQVKK